MSSKVITIVSTREHHTPLNNEGRAIADLYEANSCCESLWDASNCLFRESPMTQTLHGKHFASEVSVMHLYRQKFQLCWYVDTADTTTKLNKMSRPQVGYFDILWYDERSPKAGIERTTIQTTSPKTLTSTSFGT